MTGVLGTSYSYSARVHLCMEEDVQVQLKSAKLKLSGREPGVLLSHYSSDGPAVFEDLACIASERFQTP